MTPELAIGLILLLVGFLGLARYRQNRFRHELSPLIPPGVLIESQPVLTEAEAGFYNLLRLAVQDRYLVFAQVPLWCLLTVKTGDRKARAAVMNRIALKRVDFVLVHPGTLRVAKVVELEDASEPPPQKLERNRLIEEMLKQAGIEVVRVRGAQTVPELARLLDAAPDED